MGFKCPICNKDFGRDRKDFNKHIETNHKGIAKTFLDEIKLICEIDKDELIRELREKTGCGIMDCEKALTENDWDIEKAESWMKEKYSKIHKI